MEPWYYKPPQSLLCDRTYSTSGTWCICFRTDSLPFLNECCRVVMQTLCPETALGCSKTSTEFAHGPSPEISHTPVKIK